MGPGAWCGLPQTSLNWWWSWKARRLSNACVRCCRRSIACCGRMRKLVLKTRRSDSTASGLSPARLPIARSAFGQHFQQCRNFWRTRALSPGQHGWRVTEFCGQGMDAEPGLRKRGQYHARQNRNTHASGRAPDKRMPGGHFDDALGKDARAREPLLHAQAIGAAMLEGKQRLRYDIAR